jgi:hypothetical protein
MKMSILYFMSKILLIKVNIQYIDEFPNSYLLCRKFKLHFKNFKLKYKIIFISKKEIIIVSRL